MLVWSAATTMKSSIKLLMIVEAVMKPIRSSIELSINVQIVPLVTNIMRDLQLMAVLLAP